MTYKSELIPSIYDLHRVYFDNDNKRFLYWRNKGSQADREIMVVFNQNYGNVSLKDGMVVLSLDRLSNYNDLYSAMKIFTEEILKNKSVSIQFVIGNEQERQVAEALGKEFRIPYQIRNINQKVEQKLEEMKQPNQELESVGSKTIRTNDQGQIKKYMVEGDTVYENNDSLSLEELKQKKLAELMNDSVEMQKIVGMSKGELDQYLTRLVTVGRTAYRLESSSDQVSYDQRGQVAKEEAQREDGKVNSQLGIVQNNPSNSNSFSAVEKNSDEFQVVHPGIVHSSISSTGTVQSSASSSSVGFDYDKDVQLEDEDEQQRSVEQEYFLDEEYNIYMKDGQLVGRVGQNGYMPNYQDNTLLKDGKVIGVIGDYKSINYARDNVYVKPAVRTLTKPGLEPTKKAGFISFPVILFIFSALLLIGSAVLLFVID